MGRWELLLTALLCVLLATPVWSDNAGEAQRREDRLKAGYLFNFAKFVEWPPSTSRDALTVCFAGADGIRDYLAADASGKRVGSRKLVVRSLGESEAPDGCNVLYVDANLPSEVRASMGRLQQPMLTVSDARDFLRDGGIIALYSEDKRLRFAVSLQNARRVGLQISSNLLQLGSVVEKRGRR
jgi:hypothetical protein